MTDVPLKDIITLTQDLVRVSSTDTDDHKNVFNVVGGWAEKKALLFHPLKGLGGKVLGGYFHYDSGKPGPTVCLDACLDTAPIGDTGAWKMSPLSGHIEGDRLYGRGVADCKVAVSMFSHIFESVSKTGLDSGQLYVLLDAEEHSGNFAGVKAFLEDHNKIDVMFIGYPGDRSIKVGARGFLRSTASVYGKAEHSGSRKPATENALLKAVQLIQAINSTKLPAESDPRFPDGPKVTVTAIRGGEGFSQIPDKIEFNIDLRLTPNVDQVLAEKWLRDIIKENDRQFPTSRATTLDFRESWPAYALSPTHPAALILRENAVQSFGHDVQLEVCGPSNIGNLLAKEKIPAFCGFGVASENVHGANENVAISTVEPTYKTYLQTVRKLTRTP